MSNFIFILTEGDHDTAFLYRILKANGIETYNIAIKNYPKLINKMFIKELSSSINEELNIETVNSKFLPYRVMRKDDNILCIYKTGGDSKEEKRIEFVRKINKFNVDDPDEMDVAEDSTFSILFFFDADISGVNYRITQIKNELRPCLNNKAVENINNKEVTTINDIKIGLFVFTKAESDTGSLEDILIMLMRKDNDDIFVEAEDYLDIHERTALFGGKIDYEDDNTTIKKVNGIKYYYKKSLIGTVGQLQVSGTSNTVCISKTDYLTDDKIKSENICNEIFSFIQKVMI